MPPKKETSLQVNKKAFLIEDSPFDCYRRRHTEVRFDIHKLLEKRDYFLFYQIQTWRLSMTLFSNRYS